MSSLSFFFINFYLTMRTALSLVFCVISVFGNVYSRDTSFGSPLWSTPTQPDVCKPGPKGRVEWILYVRDSDYGWGEHTHRANIALAVNGYRGNDDEMHKMALQLEVELTRALFRTSPRIHDSDLALYIHALLALKKNPRNFHGVDLVADLLQRVETTTGTINPFLLLALCNSHVIQERHLEKLRDVANAPHSDVDSRKAQFKALAFKTYACAADIDDRFLNRYTDEKEAIRDCLNRKYNEKDGSFGNVYTTSLAVQAFTAAGEKPHWWNEDLTTRYLVSESEKDLNLIKAYYIEMGLNAKNVKFIKDLYGKVPLPHFAVPKPDLHYVQYTIKRELHPEDFLSITLQVGKATNFYEIMKKASNISEAFKFTAYQDNNGDPMVYSVSGIPNDVEENLFWRICRQHSVDHTRHVSTIEPFDESPSRLVPKGEEHVIYLYSNGNCPPQ